MKHLLFLLVFPFLLLGQISEPNLIYKNQDPVIAETLDGIVEIEKSDSWQSKAYYSLWKSQTVLYFSENFKAKFYTFYKISYLDVEYFLFKEFHIDSVKQDSLMELFNDIKNYPASKHIENWKVSVDGKFTRWSFSMTVWIISLKPIVVLKSTCIPRKLKS